MRNAEYLHQCISGACTVTPWTLCDEKNVEHFEQAMNFFFSVNSFYSFFPPMMLDLWNTV